MNNLDTVAADCYRLMVAHGVGRLEFGFDRSKRRIGATHFQRIGPTPVPVRITLSRHFASVLTMDEIRDTMLHEIAHAIAGHAAGHGLRWQSEARKLGIKPERCRTTTAAPEASWEGKCKNCGKTVRKMHRAPLKVQVHGCAHTFTQMERLIMWYKDGKAVSISDMPRRYQDAYYDAVAYDNRILLNQKIKVNA